MSDSLYGRLRDLTESDLYSFHMPGHKRLWYSMDISEISGFDNLHFPQDIILNAQKEAAALYKAAETFYLINGSTAGILSAVSAVNNVKKKLLISRNSHFSVYHAAYINDISLVYIYPQYDEATGIAYGITATEIADKLKEEPEIGAVLITSPTYEGITSDVAGIAKVTHEHGACLIVDQAHGAHFGFHPAFPENAVSQGADIVIHSLHKTLPALTQTALLHVNGERINRNKLKRFLRIYQSSSPSYPLIAGIENCIKIVKDKGEFLLSEMLEMRSTLTDRVGQLSQSNRPIQLSQPQSNRLNQLQTNQLSQPQSNRLNQPQTSQQTQTNRANQPHSTQPNQTNITHFRILDTDDPCKIVILTSGISGKELAGILREKYLLEMEMAADNYIIAIITMMDKPEGFLRLAEALEEIDSSLLSLPASQQIITGCTQITEKRELAFIKPNTPEIITTIKKAYDGEVIEIPLTDAEGGIAAEFAFRYPPGIPLIVPGEKLNRDIIEMLKGQGDTFWILR
ncbi:MAG: aminotransferase class I/II-fold pyridoxal phosphate-dependent enzyme [Lachnospiraceae bacterium]|nr:aminotransferase class I/II-fold pyridoxal phosphate-dependent enzyme [Lachnospiraceae bacterium]